LLDVSNAQRPVLISAPTIESDGKGYRIGFMPTKGDGAYLAASVKAGKTATWIKADDPSFLKAHRNEGRYVVITVPDLKDSAEELAAYRKNQGLSSHVVLLEDIYDEFNAGNADPAAIRSFLAFAVRYWKEAPEYVVLAGEGTYDYKNHRGYGDNLLPPVMMGTPQGLFASDGALADLDEDGWPDIAIGRLPVLTEQEFLRLVNRIKAYEAGGASEWRRQVVLAADNSDAGGDFSGASRALAGRIPGGYAVQSAYLGEVDLATARTTMLQSINAGAGFVNYYGHSGLDRMAQEGIMTTADVSSLTNSNRPAVITAMSCVVGQFAVPGYDCLAEVLLLTEKGGAVAVWAPTGMSLNEDARVLSESLYDALFRGGKKNLGDGILASLRDYAAQQRTKYLPGVYNLLGDPALRTQEDSSGGEEGGDVPPGDSPYGLREWKDIAFTPNELADPAISGDNSDPDGDGVPNLMEYAMGRNPKKVDAYQPFVLGSQAAADLLDGYDVVVTFKRGKRAKDVECRLEVTGSLLELWQSNTNYVKETKATDDGNGITETVTVCVRSPAPDRQKLFVRLAVRKP
jgi:hypothetical protein